MYLVDANIFLELLLEQEKSESVRSFLQHVDPSKVYISDFCIYSIGIILMKRKSFKTFLRFIDDQVIKARIIHLEPEELKIIPQFVSTFNLDFDDAYHYAIAIKYDLEIVSFDSDFDRTEKKRKTPDMILGRHKNGN